jgi:23S rRNA pseudouridine1911/1915/1917 synthase
VLARYTDATLLRCRLETGRTHQIRVHLASIGHPIIGDPVYGRRSDKARVSAFRRQALHAQELGLIHPATRKPMTWRAPLPQDMMDLMASLERNARHA